MADLAEGPGELANREEIRVFGLLAVLVRRWRWVLGSVALGVLIALAVVLFWRRSFEVETVLVPSSTGDGGIGARLMSSQLPQGVLTLAGGQPSTDQRLIGAVLRSRTLADSLLVRLGYGLDSGSPVEGEIREVLSQGTTVLSNSDGSVAIRVRDSEAERAATIANAFPDLINTVMSGVAENATIRRQEFLEAQLVVAQDQLRASEQSLLVFQQTQDAPEIQEQARRTLEAAATLQRQIIDQQVEVAQLRRTLTPDHPDLRAAEYELELRTTQLNRLTRGSGLSGDVLLPLGESSGLRVDFTRLLRDYTRDEQVYLSLTRALVEAQIDANSEVPIVSVLDPARVPLAPTGIPGRIALPVGLLLGLAFGIGGAFLREYYAMARRDPANRSFFDAVAEFKRDFLGLASARSVRATSTERADSVSGD